MGACARVCMRMCVLKGHFWRVHSGPELGVTLAHSYKADFSWQLVGIQGSSLLTITLLQEYLP